MQKPIRVLHVFGRLDRGGAETEIMNLYREIDRSKIQFDFVKHTDDSCSYDDEILSLGGHIYSAPAFNIVNLNNYKNFWTQFFERHSEHKIVHGHMRTTAFIYLALAKKYNKETIAHSHSISNGIGFYAKIKDILQLPIRNTANFLFACTDEAGRWLFGNDVVNRSNYFLIKNAIDPRKYEYNVQTRTSIRKKLNLEENVVIGHVGRFIPVKNQNFLLEVFCELVKKNSEVKLLMIGEGKDREKIENKINSLNLKSKVILLGERSDVADLMQAMDIFVFPSINEGLGMVAIEAQAAGLPVLASSSIPEDIKVTQNIKQLPLDKNAIFWANEIIEVLKGFNRIDTAKDIRSAGYDIKDTVNWLSDFYINIVEYENYLNN